MYDKYPKQNIKRHSIIVEVVIILNFFRTNELIKPVMAPVIVEKIHKNKKLPIILKGVT